MPVKNTVRIDVAEAFYHVYSRGNNKQIIFESPEDFSYFLSLFDRYLGTSQRLDSSGRPYPNFHKEIELAAYCLMPNHFHMLVYQHKEGSLKKLMQAVMTSYTRGFNKHHNRRGPLFESRYKSVAISTHEYLEHISRYIHLNPGDWKEYPYSSLAQYLGKPSPDWLKIDRIIELFDNRDDYEGFVSDYEGHKKMLDSIKHELANY